MLITDNFFSGERPLYESRDLRLERVTIGEGESGLKESRRIEAVECRFEGMYVIWECEDATCRNCYFAPSDRAPLWYCRSGQISDLQIEQAQYAFMHASQLQISNIQLQGKYAFQYARNIEIHNAILDTKDAFWNSENVTVYDSEIKSEYLGWYSKNLRLVRCRIAGTQPLCYAENLVLEDCSFAPDADRAFEKSSVKATILGDITSIVDPLPGSEIRKLEKEPLFIP